MDNISISLSLQGWNIVLNALGQRPYVEVSDLIRVIQKQAEDAVNVQKTEAPVKE